MATSLIERSQMRGRAATALVVVPYLLIMVAGYSVRPRSFWRFFLVPGMDQYFLDLRNVLSGWDCLRRGVDVLQTNPCDPLGRPMNYTYPWRLAASLGLGEAQALVTGIVLVAAFLVCVWFLMGPTPLREAPIWIVALCSPAVMFGVERANPDLMIFVLTTVYALLFTSETVLKRLGAYGAIGAAALLKLFPVFAFVTLLRARPPRKAAFSILCLVLVAFAIVTFDDYSAIYGTTQKGWAVAYGSRVLIDGWTGQDGYLFGIQPFSAEGFALGSGLALCVIGAGLIMGARRWSQSVLPERLLVSYWAGASIYVGTFLLGNNWDYRMTFLLFTLPLLLHVRRGGGGNGALATRLGALLLFELWVSITSVANVRISLLEELVSWGLLFGISAGLGATFRAWTQPTR